MSYNMNRTSEHGNQRQEIPDSYFAGLIDGEGSLIFRRNKGLGQFTFMAACGMVTPEPLEALKAKFGGGIYVSKSKNGFRDVYKWSIQNEKGVYHFIKAIRPWLLVKHRQADTILEEMATRKVRKNSDAPRKLEEKELERREAVYQTMKRYNAVGISAATTNREDTCQA